MKQLTILFIFFLISCNDVISEEPVGEKYVDTTVVVHPEKTLPQKLYYFTVITYDEPTSVYKNYSTEEEEIKWDARFAISDINEITGSMTEEFEYRCLDKMEENLRKTNLQAMLNHTQIKIRHRQLFPFDSYKYASISRRKFLDGKYTEVTNFNTDETVFEID